MRKENYISHNTSINQWLESKVSLANTSRMAYRGEVQRMSEYLDKIGIQTTSEISREEWWSYLASLTNNRESVLTKRCDELKIGSIHQARRITRDFFMWALDDELIDWLPRLPPIELQNETKHEDESHSKQLDKKLIKILLGKKTAKGLKDSRVYLMINLIFWGGLKPTELIKLSISDLKISNTVSIYSQLQNRTITLPKHLAKTWGEYIQNRNGLSEEPAKPNAPLISQLGQNQRLSGWSIWAAFQEWHQNHGSKDYEIITPRELRNRYLKLLCNDGDSTLEVACAIGGIKERTVTAIKHEVPNGFITSMHNQISNRLMSYL